MKKKQLILSRGRDVPLLHFLWKWKLSSTPLLAIKFFAGKKIASAYKRLWELKCHGFIKIKVLDDSGEAKAWCLDQRGFKLIQDDLPALREVGFRSEHPRHDFWCNVLHLGDFAKQAPSDVFIVSEQQLRRFDEEFLPDFIPDPKRHRPDGYWYFSKREKLKTIALEVELSRKETLAFHDAVEFYRDYRRIDGVLWVMPNLATIDRFMNLVKKLCERRVSVHNFVLFDDFCQNGWKAVIKAGGNKGKTIANFLLQDDEFESTNPAQTSYHGLISDTSLIRRNYGKFEGGLC